MKNRKLFVIMCIGFVCMLGLSSCGNSDNPKGLTERMMPQFQKASTYTNAIGIEDKNYKALGGKLTEGQVEQAAQIIARNVKYKVGEEKINGKEAEVKVTITTKKFGDAVIKAKKSKANFEGADFIKAIDEAKGTYEKSVYIKFKKDKDGNWAPVPGNRELTEALFGGLLDVK